jgi:hypothetical protein
MKKILLTIVFAISASAFAQSTTKEDIDIVQSVYGKSKMDIVNNYMSLSGEKLDKFMKVYDKYESERKSLGRKKIELIDEYAKNYMSLTDDKANDITKAILKNNMDYQKLYSKYYDQFKKAIGAMDAAKFMQLEIYLQTTIQAEIQDSVPFIGEIDRTKKSQN